jgi:hypothetical protein
MAASCSTVIKIPVPHKTVNLLTGQGTISFSRRQMIHAVILCRKISPSFVDRHKCTLLASQPRYGEGGEAIALKASCYPSPLALSIVPFTVVTQPRLADILRQVCHISILSFHTEKRKEQLGKQSCSFCTTKEYKGNF